MKNYVYLGFILFSLSLEAKTLPQATAARVIVLCDVSHSISQAIPGHPNRLGEMKTMCAQLLRHYPPGSHIAFYLITSNAVFVPFAEFDAEEVMQRTAWHTKKQLGEQTKLIGHVIDSAAKAAEHQTCILTSVEDAFEEFAAQNNGSRNELYIFSDLLEQCDQTSTGRIWMKEGNEPLLTKAEQERADRYSPKKSWGGIHPKVTVINISAAMSPTKKNEIQAFWTKLLHRMGARSDNSTEIPFLARRTFAPDPNYQ